MDERELFIQALQVEDLPARQQLLQQAAGNDDALRRRVEGLLEVHARAASFLESPPANVSPTIESAQSEHPGALIGRYKLLEQVGEGGMGVVFVAEQTKPVRRRVALKIIKPGMDTKQVIARFEAERQALAMMDHPNIARVLDAGTTEAGRPYFVMELVRGMPITEYCDKAKLSPRQRLELFIDVCQAVQHAHQKGIIHRDLKPSNVMVTMQDGRPVVKVIDFGVAKAVGQQLTERTVYTALTQLVGTPLYMSPEQAELTSHDVDTRSDVYSLGVLLYELLTGQTPFDKETLAKAGLDEMRRMIREDEPLRPSRRLSTLGAQAISTASQHRSLDERRLSKILRGELDWIVMKALEKDRSRRYESASALAADIQRYLSDEPVLACPPTTMYRFQKFARKHKPALATAAAIVACLVLGTTVSAWQAVRATTAEAQANANEAQAKEAAAAEAKQRQRAEANEQKANTQRDEAQRQRDEVRALNEKLQATQGELRSTLYAAHMNLAKSAWDAGHTGRVLGLLEQNRPKPGEADPRGFEWHYLNRLCHSDLLTIEGSGVAYSPDGKRLAGASTGGMVKVWDAQTGQELLSLKGHTQGVNRVVFSPDGQRLASGSGGLDERGPAAGDVKLWDARTGQELLTIPLNAPLSDVRGLAFSPDGKRLASALVGFDDKFVPLADQEVRVWDAQTGQELLTLKLKGIRGNDIASVAFSPDGQRLASPNGADRTVKVWDAQTGQELLTFKGHSGTVWDVVFSPDGKRLASSGGEELKVWDAQTGAELLTAKGKAYIAFSPDGKRLASAGGRELKVLDAQSGRELLSLKGHIGAVRSVAFSPDGKRLASASSSPNGNRVTVWDAQTGQEPLTLKHTTWVAGVAFSLDGQRLASASDEFSEGGVVKVWDVQTNMELLTLKLAGQAVAFSPDGQRLASGFVGDHTVNVWNAQTGQELLTLKGHTSPAQSVAFSPDGTRLASASGGLLEQGQPVPGDVRVWDARTGQELLILKGHTSKVTKVVFSPDGKRLASASWDQTVKVWDAQTGRELVTLQGHTRGRGDVAFSPDGKRLASAYGKDQTAMVWDAQTGQELLTLKGHTGTVRGVAFSPDGQRLASTSADQTLKVWDAQTGQETLTLDGHATLSGVVFSPNGQRLASHSRGQSVTIWDATPLPEKP